MRWTPRSHMSKVKRQAEAVRTVASWRQYLFCRHRFSAWGDFLRDAMTHQAVLGSVSGQMLSQEKHPEGEEDGVENALLDIGEQEHEGGAEHEAEPFHRNCKQI